MTDLIPVTYRPPFAIGREPWRDVRKHGQTILEIVQTVPDLPKGFINRGGVVCINGEIVPRNLWSLVRPKPTNEALPISVTLHWPLQNPGGGGGGSSTTKSIIGIVAAIALVVVTQGIAAGAFPFLVGAGFAAGTLPTLALAGAVGIAGALAISALTAPPTSQPAAQAQLADNTNQDNRDPAGAAGNVIAPGGSIPRIVGTRKVFPPYICEPVVQLLNTEDERIECVMALNGPHDISDIKIDGVSITSAPEIEYETKLGDPLDSALNLVVRQGRTTTLQMTLSQHKLASDDVRLANNSPSTDYPLWHRFTTFDSPDAVWIHLLFPGGIANQNNSTIAVPFRVRMRLIGDVTWINLPEIHLAQSAVRALRRQIRIIFIATPGGLLATNSIPDAADWYYARYNTPGQSISPASSGWNTSSYFSGGPGGNDFVWFGNEGSTTLNNMALGTSSADFYVLNGFPKGRYEIEIMRGSAYDISGFSRNLYQYGGSVLDFFTSALSGSDYVVPQDQTNIVSTAMIVRMVSIWNEHPVVGGQGAFALIAIRAINRQVNRVSCIASGRVQIWNGSTWTTPQATSNPSAHYRYVLLGAQNHDPLDSTLVDNDGLVDWYTKCITFSWTCDAIIDDMRTQDVLALIASCGYARPYQSDIYGVTIDDNRSATAPVQVFSRINTINMKYEKAFARVPSGLIITYHRAPKDYENDQEIVNQTDPSVGITGLYEAISYDGIVNQGRVAARGKFDLDQTNLRSTFYSFEADIESLVCRRGSLVAIQHDILTSRAGDAHVKTVLTSGGNITGLVLDSQIDVSATTGIAIRRSAGGISVHQVASESHGGNGGGSTITFSTPFAIPPGGTIIGYDDTNDEYGCMIVSGDLGTEYKRMLVFSITPTKDLRANVVLVDEAQELVRFGE